MPQTPHLERHFTSSEVVRDIVIGMSDGLTVPFELADGLTGAVYTTRIIVTAGLAEIAAGTIAMGLGGYLAAKSDAEHYAKEREREKREVAEIPHEEMREVAEVFEELLPVLHVGVVRLVGAEVAPDRPQLADGFGHVDADRDAQRGRCVLGARRLCR